MWIPDYQFNVLSGFFWQATYKRNDLQKNEKKKQLPRVEKVLIYVLSFKFSNILNPTESLVGYRIPLVQT
jgi:hypothetical protein